MPELRQVPVRFRRRRNAQMRFPPDRFMEALLAIALGIAVVVVIFAMQDAPRDRTRFTLERSQISQIVERRAPLEIEETSLGR
jgi:hypothetical protein